MNGVACRLPQFAALASRAIASGSRCSTKVSTASTRPPATSRTSASVSASPVSASGSSRAASRGGAAPAGARGADSATPRRRRRARSVSAATSRTMSGMGSSVPGSRSIGQHTHPSHGGTRMAAERRSERGDRWAVPVLRARAGGPAERFAARIGVRHPAAVFFAALLAGFVVLAGVSRAARAARDRRARARRWRRADRREHDRDDRRRAHAVAHGRVGGRLGRRRRARAADPRRADRAGVRRAAQVADRGVRRVRARRRVGDLPRDDAARAARPARRGAARGPARGRELPLGSHRRIDRGVHRPRAAAHVRDPRAGGCASPPGAWPSCSRSWSRRRACTAACTIRSTSPAAWWSGVGAVLVLLFACRAAAARADAARPV